MSKATHLNPVLTKPQERAKQMLSNTWVKADGIGISPRMLKRLIALRVAIKREADGVEFVSLVQLDLFESE